MTYISLFSSAGIGCYGFKEAGFEIEFITYDMTEKSLPDNIITEHEKMFMDEGMIAEEGTPEEIFESGICKKIFGIGIERIQTEDGWQYFYDDRERE